MAKITSQSPTTVSNRTFLAAVGIIVLAIGITVFAMHSRIPAAEKQPAQKPPATITQTTPIAGPLDGYNGYRIQGNTIYNAANQIHIFRGVSRPSLEWRETGEQLSLADYQAIQGWGANIVRLPLNQVFWEQDASGYRDRIQQNVTWIEQSGMDVILDLHWSDQGNNSIAAQQKMSDMHSVSFWREVAGTYKDDPQVLFELYNEPHDISCDVWQNGGTVDGWQAAGMQQLYDTVRLAGARNIVIIGGLNWAFDLRCVQTNRVTGFNIAYATHIYNDYGKNTDSDWENNFGYLTPTDAIIMTEFGDTTNHDLAGSTCTGDFDRRLLNWAHERQVSWVAWAWFPGDCNFPPLIRNWQAAPNAAGDVVREFLLK